MAILVTGGAGFIGSHTCVELLNAGEDIVVMDNFYNSNSRALDGIRKITGKDFKFYEDDMLDIAAVDQIFAENDIEQVIHFAGYKCVPESVQKPLMYYSNNLRGTFNILETMKAAPSSCSALPRPFTESPRPFPLRRIFRCPLSIPTEALSSLLRISAGRCTPPTTHGR